MKAQFEKATNAKMEGFQRAVEAMQFQIGQNKNHVDKF